MRKTMHAGCCRTARVLACFLCLLLALHTPAAADLTTYPHPDVLCTLKVQYDLADHGIDGIPFRLYRIAAINEEAAYTLLPPFDGYNIRITPDTTSSQWQDMADTLVNYIHADQVPPMQEIASVGGRVDFGAVPTGLYLVMSAHRPVGELYFNATSTLVSLPNRQGGGWWTYDLTVNPKIEIEQVQVKDLRVRKVWLDDGWEDRPVSVTVELYCDGDLFDTVVLSGENQWTHVWEDLNGMFNWSVVEREVPAGYAVSIMGNAAEVVVTNTRTDPPDDPDDPDLPQTGTDWMPVTTLAAVGMMLFAIGYMQLKKGKGEQE